MKNRNELNIKINYIGILYQLKPYYGNLALLLLLSFLGSGLNLIVPGLIGQGIDQLSNKSLLTKIIIEFFAITFLIFIVTYIQGLLQTYVAEKVARELRSQIINNISLQQLAYIEDIGIPRLITNLSADVDSIKLFISQAIVTIASSFFIIVGTCFFLIKLNFQLGLIIITIIPIIGLTFFIIIRRVKELFTKSRENIDVLNRVVSESVLGASLIRIVNSSHLECNKFFEANFAAKSTSLSILTFFSWLIPAILLISNIAGLVIFALGGYGVVNSSMTIGDFTAFLSYLTLLVSPILIIGMMSNIIAQVNASFKRLRKLLVQDILVAKDSISSKLLGAIAIEHISLNYKEKCVLNNISISILPEEKVAIVGPTGAGKTQLLQLLIGLKQPTSGTVLFDNHALSLYESREFYNQVGFIFQESLIFNTSILENITFNDVITEDSLNRALYTSGLTDFINHLPEGLQTIISERGQNLSGGQKQRIMLARALIKNPKILILDDFTSRVDNNTESEILKKISTEYPNSTFISVTQRISSVLNYDRIILLIKGEKVAEGRHEDLLDNSQEYAEFFHAQRTINA